MHFWKKYLKVLSCFFFLINLIKISHTTAHKIKKFNILMMIVDDLRHLVAEDVNLGYINNLAAKGTSFKNTFAQQALCAPSRNSMLTGRRPDSLRLYDFYSYWRDTVGNFTTLPQYFKENGYRTYSVGKIFHPGKSSNKTDDYPLSWSFEPYHPSTEIYEKVADCKDNKWDKKYWNLVCPVVVRKQIHATLPDIESTEKAIKILKRAADDPKPFFLAVGFHKPHINFKFPRKFLRKVPKENVKLPEMSTMPQGMPTVAWHPWMDVKSRNDIARLNISFPYGTMPKNWTKRIKRAYFAAALYIDELVGKILNYVDFQDTIVVLTSDHGWSLGENGLWAKYSNFDVALKVPLIIRSPRMNAYEIKEPVELIDLFPTLVDLAGLPNNIPKCKNNVSLKLCFEGKSLVSLMKGITSNEEAVSLSQYPRPSVKPEQKTDKPRLKDIKIMGYSLRTERYRYTEWIAFNNTDFTRNWNKNYGTELYDHYTDPFESRNLLWKPEFKRTLQLLSKLLRSKVDPHYFY